MADVTFDGAADATFSVDSNARTVSGVVIPFNVVGNSQGRQWRFSKDSVSIPADASRVPLLLDHDITKPVGVAQSFSVTDTGITATFSVPRTAAGDEFLTLAASKVRGGLSAGVAFGSADIEQDVSGVLDVLRGSLCEVSSVTVPAFSDARLTTVRLSAAGKEIDMPDDITPAAGPNVTAITDAITAGFSAMEKAAPKPGLVPVATVTEEPVYRFDGIGGKHDFSSDIFASLRDHDAEAGQRLDKFLATFAVTKSNAATLNPNGQRPDMYVDQKAYVATPVWDAIQSGSLANSTPFVIPKFSSASGLIGDHTEGVEPTSGSFAATAQTITPSAVSGKVTLTREVIDQGGNPQLSGLIFSKIQRAYQEALEAKAVALLDSVSPTQITLTAGGADDVLDADLTAALAALHYVRGGLRMRDFAVQVDLYRALVGAVDANGRHLFPILSPVNSNGSTAEYLSSVNVAGIQAIPAWALAATGTVAASSYLFDRSDVHGWATPLRKFEFDYQVATVELAGIAYVATAITDLTGVREVLYDPTA
jgi:HK97 family phage prohead protease